MSDETDRQSILDEEHLKLLSLGYMVSGGFAALFSLFGLLYVVMGIVMAVSFSQMPQAGAKAADQPPEFLGWIFAGVGLVLFLGMIAIAAAKFWVAACIKRRKSRTFCMVIAGLSCLEFPYGTLLGVLTFIVLGRASVERVFSEGNKMAMQNQ
jgi:hypothetical protein